MDEKLARWVTDELVKVVRSKTGAWVVSCWIGTAYYHLTYDREEAANSAAESLRTLTFLSLHPR